MGELNHSNRDYTHFSAPHQSYARIDNILVPPTLLPLTQKVTIIDNTWSDHSLVLLTMQNSLTRPMGSHWRQNKSILSYPVLTTKIKKSLKQYFLLNKIDYISPKTLWAAHKATNRGKIIGIAIQLKKD